jgi:hypothetical protein
MGTLKSFISISILNSDQKDQDMGGSKTGEKFDGNHENHEEKKKGFLAKVNLVSA